MSAYQKKDERPEFKPYEQIDLTTFFDKIDFGVELTGDWQKDEARLIAKRAEEMLNNYKKRKLEDIEDVSKLSLSDLDI